MSEDSFERRPQSVADFYEALMEAERLRTEPRTPPGDLEDDELYQGLHRLAGELFRARARARLTQEQVAASMGISKSGVARLEGRVRHAPSVSTLMRFAKAVGCELEIRLVPRASDSALPSTSDRAVPHGPDGFLP